ncbi:unnamed protein product, partial [Effrenium voratum]
SQAPRVFRDHFRAAAAKAEKSMPHPGDAEAGGVQISVEEIDPGMPAHKASHVTHSSSAKGGSSMALQAAANKNAKFKKELRDAFLKDSSAIQETEDETCERPEKFKRAKEFMKKTACTDENDDWLTLRTTPKELGQYGVGVQLYFEYLADMGLLFVVLFLLTLPLLYFSLGGTVLNDFPELSGQSFAYKLMAAFSPANLGTCGEGAEDCLTDQALTERKVFPGSEQKVRDVTPALGILDFVQMLLGLGFIFWFRIYKIPRAVRIQDEANVTASDFGIRVSGLPRKLDKDHEKYEDYLQMHFERILATECSVKDATGQVAEVALIREYDGCISKFLQQGNLLEEMHEAGVASRLAKKNGKDKDAEKHDKKRTKLKGKILSLEAEMEHQADMKDEDREVCGAFVMFETEQQKDAILNVYKPFNNSYMARLVQPKYLRFRDWRLHVIETCEPEELYWENMDYSWVLHKARKFMTLTVSFLIVVLCIFILTFLRSSQSAVDTSSRPHDLWLFELAERARGVDSGPPGPSPCMEFCQLDLYFDDRCHDPPRTGTEEYMQTIYDTAQIWCNSSSLVVNSPPGTRSATRFGPLTGELEKEFWSVFSRAFAQHPASVTRYRTAQYRCQGRGTKGSGYFDTNGDVWSKDTYCLRFDDAILQGYNFPQPVKMRSDCLFPVTLEAAQLAVAQGESFSNSQRIECFCAQQTALEPFLRIPGYLDTPQAKVCEEWAWFQGTQMGVRAGGVIAVMVINNVLLIIFAYFDSLGRYQTATDLAASQVFNLFFATLVNTAVVYLLIGMNVYTSDNSFFGAFGSEWANAWPM